MDKAQEIASKAAHAAPVIRLESESRGPAWREVTVNVPVGLAQFMERVNWWEWTGAHIVLGCQTNDAVARMAHMASIVRDIVELGPRSCAKGRIDFHEFADLRKQLDRIVSQMHARVNFIAEAARVRAPKTPDPESRKDTRHGRA